MFRLSNYEYLANLFHSGAILVDYKNVQLNINMNRKQKILLFSSLVVIALLGALYVSGFRFFKKTPQFISTNVASNEKDVDPNTIPGNLPQNLPQNDGAVAENKIVTSQFLDATYNNKSETQSVRRYYSSKTLAENAKEFEEYFKTNSWTVTHKQEESNMIVFYAESKEVSGVLKVLISKNSVTGDVMVETSLTE